MWSMGGQLSKDEAYIEIRCRLSWFIFSWSADFELVGFKNADLAFALHMGSALLSGCSNRQPLFTFIHRRKVSCICRMLRVGKIALRLKIIVADRILLLTLVLYDIPLHALALLDKSHAYFTEYAVVFA